MRAVAIWGDYDNDGDLDILLTGNTGTYHDNYISKIYRNDSNILNLPPSIPYNLKAAVNGNNVTFSWDKSTDKETLQNGLTYNLIIGTSPGHRAIYYLQCPIEVQATEEL